METLYTLTSESRQERSVFGLYVNKLRLSKLATKQSIGKKKLLLNGPVGMHRKILLKMQLNI